MNYELGIININYYENPHPWVTSSPLAEPSLYEKYEKYWIETSEHRSTQLTKKLGHFSSCNIIVRH